MIASRPGPGRPPPGPDGLVIAAALTVRRDTAPECEASAPPDIRAGCAVVLVRTAHHPADRNAQRHHDQLLRPATAPDRRPATPAGIGDTAGAGLRQAPDGDSRPAQP